MILTGSAAAGCFTKEVVVSHNIVYCRLFFYSGQQEREREGEGGRGGGRPTRVAATKNVPSSPNTFGMDVLSGDIVLRSLKSVGVMSFTKKVSIVSTSILGVCVCVGRPKNLAQRVANN
jgi:hypothetical protein